MTTKTKKNLKTTASTMATTMATVMTNTMKSAITMITGEQSVTERMKISTAVATTTQMADDNIQTKLTRTATKPVKTEMVGDRKEMETMVVEALVAATAKVKVIGKGKNTAATKETQMTKEAVITISSDDNKMKPKLDTASNTPAAITSTPPSYRITSAASRPPPPMPPPSLPPPSSSDKEELLSIRTHPTLYGKAGSVVLVRPAYSADVTAMQREEEDFIFGRRQQRKIIPYSTAECWYKKEEKEEMSEDEEDKKMICSAQEKVIKKAQRKLMGKLEEAAARVLCAHKI